MRAVERVLLVIAAYTFVGWAYIALNAVVHPESLGWPLTHLTSWPHEDTFGILCLSISFTAAMAATALRGRR